MNRGLKDKNRWEKNKSIKIIEDCIEQKQLLNDFKRR